MEIWQVINNILKENLTEPNFQILVNSVEYTGYSQNILKLSIEQDYTRTWFKDKCEPILIENFRNTPFENIIIQYQINPKEQVEIPQLSLFNTPKVLPKEEDIHVELNKNLTFENYIVGNNNRFAHAAAIAVANKPAKAYNPLFIYGSAGLGKTHLLHAIGLKIRAAYPEKKICLVTSERFTNELIAALKEKKTHQFKEKYRGVDVLMIDDIQFVAGKESTQEELFHTFNELHANSKQIVLTSDRLPKDIPTLQERLKTRFSWGLVADIQAPELETRIAILQKKADLHNILIPNEILHFLATQIPSNVRELEGALTKIIAYASIMNTEITLAVASNMIKDMNKKHSDRPLTIGYIKKKVADFFNVSIDDLSAKTRTKEIAYVRQVAMYLARELTNASLPKIGENFGNRDHSTVMHACDKIKSLMESNPETMGNINTLIFSIQSGE